MKIVLQNKKRKITKNKFKEYKLNHWPKNVRKSFGKTLETGRELFVYETYTEGTLNSAVC